MLFSYAYSHVISTKRNINFSLEEIEGKKKLEKNIHKIACNKIDKPINSKLEKTRKEK